MRSNLKDYHLGQANIQMLNSVRSTSEHDFTVKIIVGLI